MRKLLVVLAIVTVLASCGGGSSGKAKTASDSANDQAITDAAVLGVTELPAGFTEDTSDSSSSSDSPEESAASEQFDACLSTAVGASAKELEAGRTAKTKRKFKGSGDNVSAEVELYADAAQVAKQLDAFRNDAAIECVIEGIRGTIPAGFTLDDIKALDRPVAPEGGAAAAIQFTVSAGNTQLTAIDSIYIAAKGRGEVTLTVVTSNPGDALYVDSAIKAMLDRLP
jgi:hypothetical protein